MLVLKFGGTSVQNALALRQVASIVQSAHQQHGALVVVLSATSGTTNTLLQLADKASKRIDIQADLEELQLRHCTIARELYAGEHANITEFEPILDLCSELQQFLHGIHVLEECTAESLDVVTSFGERLSTTIFAKALQHANLNAHFFDVRTVVKTNNNHQHAQVDFPSTNQRCVQRLQPLLESNAVVVTQGFIGSTAQGVTTTLGRGGSDYSAAILGAALGAAEIQIWTDVSGVYSADPRIVAAAQPIKQLSFSEVRELALYGAKVLHPDTIAPAIEANIPVRVVNTFAPQDSGTLITHDEPQELAIHAVTALQACLCIEGGAELFQLMQHNATLARHRVFFSSSLEQCTLVVQAATGEIELNITVALANTTHETIPCSILAVSGPRTQSIHNISRITTALQDIPVIGIHSGVGSNCVFVLCSPEHSKSAIRAIHAIILPS